MACFDIIQGVSEGNQDGSIKKNDLEIMKKKKLAS
jgi:hypothetical protein